MILRRLERALILGQSLGLLSGSRLGLLFVSLLGLLLELETMLGSREVSPGLGQSMCTAYGIFVTRMQE
jgi:hypothetical protein